MTDRITPEEEAAKEILINAAVAYHYARIGGESAEALRKIVTATQNLIATRQPDILKRIVSEQANDAGLWFVAETAPEAYLQQELRRLHSAIERVL